MPQPTNQPMLEVAGTVPAIVRESGERPDEKDLARKRALLTSTDMTPVEGTVDVNVPIAVLWRAFANVRWWPRWNKCFFWTHNRDLVLGDRLIWAFEPIRWWYLYKMFAIANIVELEEGRKVTWQVTALPGFYARHTYHMQDLGDGQSRFGSWEQARGAQIRFPLTKKFWVAHFTFVKDRSLEGARRLEEVYRREGKITSEGLKPRGYWLFWLSTLATLLALGLAGVLLWFYVSYLRPIEIGLAPGVRVVLAGGSNSLIVEDGGEALLLDTKFPPASKWLRKRTQKLDAPVRKIVNTHYHYDHTQGNVEYPGATIYAYRNVPELMRTYDADWWRDHQAGIPTQLVDDVGVVKVGGQEVVLSHPGPGHTQGDLWAYLRRGDKDIVATGDLVFHTYYPFMDLTPGGIDLPGLIGALRMLAHKYPAAIFVPGHGPLATAHDLESYADYLQALSDAVAEARGKGWTEDQAVSGIELSKWNLSRLPSFHDWSQCWATAEMNIRWVYQLEAGTRVMRRDCTF